MSARTRSPVKLGLVRVPDEGSHRNFAEVNKAMSEMHPVVSSKETGAITLVAGVNRVRPPISHPSGRQVIWQNAHATIIDVQRKNI